MPRPSLEAKRQCCADRGQDEMRSEQEQKGKKETMVATLTDRVREAGEKFQSIVFIDDSFDSKTRELIC